MKKIRARFVGVELYFENLDRAKRFYADTLGLEISEEQAGHHAKFAGEAGFICLERKGSEAYPSKDKAVLFIEVPELKSAIAAIGPEKLVRVETTWAGCTIPRRTTCFCCRNQRELPYCAPKRTDTSFETPGSCIVTP